MKIVEIAECFDRKRIREEVLPRCLKSLSEEDFEFATETFLFHAKGNAFYVKEIEGEMHIFAPHSDDISIELVFGDAWVDIAPYVCPLPELDEEDLIFEEKELDEEDDLWVDPTLYLAFRN